LTKGWKKKGQVGRREARRIIERKKVLEEGVQRKRLRPAPRRGKRHPQNETNTSATPGLGWRGEKNDRILSGRVTRRDGGGGNGEP